MNDNEQSVDTEEVYKAFLDEILLILKNEKRIPDEVEIRSLLLKQMGIKYPKSSNEFVQMFVDNHPACKTLDEPEKDSLRSIATEILDEPCMSELCLNIPVEFSAPKGNFDFSIAEKLYEKLHSKESGNK